MSKYNAKRKEVDGIKFDSTKEADRYCQLKLLLRANEISDLQLQVPYVLIEKSKWGREVKYYADFVYKEGGEIIVEDCKGMRLPLYKLKKRLFQEKYNIDIKET